MCKLCLHCKGSGPRVPQLPPLLSPQCSYTLLPSRLVNLSSTSHLMTMVQHLVFNQRSKSRPSEGLLTYWEGWQTLEREIWFSYSNPHLWSKCPSACEHFLSVPSTERYPHCQVIQGPHEFTFHLPTTAASSIILSWCLCNYTKLKVFSFSTE